jgi:hypothetical protein
MLNKVLYDHAEFRLWLVAFDLLGIESQFQALEAVNKVLTLMATKGMISFAGHCSPTVANRQGDAKAWRVYGVWFLAPAASDWKLGECRSFGKGRVSMRVQAVVNADDAITYADDKTPALRGD